MKTELIQAKDYLLFIEVGAEIKEEDYYHWKLTNTVQINRLFEEDRRLGRKGPRGHVSKAIAYRKLNDNAKELDLPLLPSFEDIDIEKEALDVSELKNKWGHLYTFGYPSKPYPTGFQHDLNMIMLGLYKSKSKQYSLKHIKKTIEMARTLFEENMFDIEEILGLTEVCTHNMILKYSEEEIIQSLSTQQLPKEFIPEYEYQTRENEWKSVLLPSEWFGSDEGDNPKRFKTIINSDGKQELVGTWKFAE